jgi:protein gp37
MAQTSAIEWTDATWNPVTGCSKLSAGCDHCYAERFSERFRGVSGHPFENGFDLTLRPERIRQPLSWRRPRMIFVNSMSDLFHKEIPRTFLDAVFATMEAADWHVFQVLTKRSSLLRRYVQHRYSGRETPPHIWLGVSVESRQVRSRVLHLRDSNVSVRFLSVEPLLEDVGILDLRGIHWVIVGGESGQAARPMRIEWARRIRDQCEKQNVPFFFKQWGAFGADGIKRPKKLNGRMLDERTWDELPIGHMAAKLGMGSAGELGIRLGLSTAA